MAASLAHLQPTSPQLSPHVMVLPVVLGIQQRPQLAGGGPVCPLPRWYPLFFLLLFAPVGSYPPPPSHDV